MDVASLAASVVDGVIVLTLCEGLLLAWWFRRTARGVPPREFLANMMSGLCLMLALRSAVTQGTGVATLLWLTAAGVAHGADLWRRWRGENTA
jgi:hypothetical protein